MTGETGASDCRGRVLVADDDPSNVSLLKRVLASAGYRDVHGIEDAGQLAGALYSLDPDLLLLDWHMAPASGADVLSALRADSRWSELPVIVVTADPDARLQSLELGATDFLTKPFDHAEILFRVRNVLRVRMLHRQVQAYNEQLERRIEDRTSELAEANQRLREAELVRRDFIAMASHEMRTPLTVIRGFIDLWAARGVPAPGTGAEQIEGMRRNVRRLEHLVHNLLLASRVETGGERHRRRTFEFREVLDAALLASVTTEPVQLTHDAHGLFQGDPELLTVVVTNLISNAERYGAPPIEIRTTTVPGGLELRLDDHGPGVPEEFIPLLFERFTQGTVGDRRTSQGAGLGLWVSHHIVEMHGGRLWYERAPCGGATFAFRLPATQATT